jgi:hypothetical protein
MMIPDGGHMAATTNTVGDDSYPGGPEIVKGDPGRDAPSEGNPR